MRKIYSLMLLVAALLCLPTGVKAVTVLEEGFEGDLSNWTQQRCHEKSVIGTEAKYTGAKGFVFNYNTNPPQYLISKELNIPANASDLSLEFYYKAYRSSYEESFKVGYSTTTNDVTSENVFIWDEEVKTSSTTFAKYTPTITIPSNVKYIAIAYTANNKYKLYIDDLKLTCAVSGPAMSVYDGDGAIASGYNYSFGLATAGTAKTFTLKNEGTEAAPVSIAHTGGFGAELSAASIPAGGEVTLTVTMPETSGEDVITISSTAEGIEDFVINVSGTVRDASKLYETLLGGAIPEDWSTTGTWSWNTTNGATNTTWYESNNYRLITPLLIVTEGETFIFEAKGNYNGYHGMKFEYSADGTNWTASSTTTTLTTDWQTFTINDIPAGNYYVAIHGWYMSVRNFYGGTLPAKVRNVAATGITDSEATIGWTAHGTEEAWQVSYSTISGDPDNGTIVDATSTSKVLSGLSATTTYYVSVRIGSTGIWSNEISFTTACGAETAPVKWTFESETADAVPSCWDNSGSESTTASGSSAYYIWGVYNVYSTGNHLLRLYNTMVNTGTALINTPRIEIPAASSYELAFEYSHKASCGAFVVKVSKDNGANWSEVGSYTNETGSNGTTPGDFIEATIDLTEYAGETILVQFCATADYNSGAIFIDNVEVRAKSNCPAPKNVTVSSVTANTASVAWTEKGDATAWKLQTSEDGESWSEEITADTNPFVLTGLEAQMTYYVRVKAVCSESESSDWSDASAAFTTQCEAATLPFATEGFDAIPACWSAASAWTIYSYDGNSNSTSIRVKNNAADLTTPVIQLSEKAQLSFYLSGSNSVRCLVYVNDGESEVQAGEVTATSSWKQATVDLSTYAGKSVNIIFRSSSSSYYLYIDDVAVNYAPVAAVTNVAVSPANRSAVVTWESAEEGVTFSLRYRTQGEGDWSLAENIDAKTYTIDGLTNGTVYEVQVKAVASANRESDWTASATVTPVDCPTVSEVTLGASTYNSVVVNWTANAAGTWTLRYQQGELGVNVVNNITENTYTLTNLVTGAPYSIEVKASCAGDEAYVAAPVFTPSYSTPASATVSGITDAAATASWEAVADATDGYKYAVVTKDAAVDWASATATTELTASLAGLSALTEYDFYVCAVYGENLGEAVKTSFTTIAIAPKDLAVSEITATSAKLSWENEGAATAYEYATGDADALVWNEVAAKELTLSGLTANTSYTAYVRTVYANGVKSDSISVTFRTECEAYALPFEQNFNALTEAGTIPDCWDNAEGTTTNATYKWSYNASGHDGACVRFESYNNAKNNTNILATPVITLSEDAVLKFWCKNPVGGAYEVQIAADGGERETLLSGLTSISDWTEKEVNLSAYTGKSVVIYFCGTSNYGNGTQATTSLYLDDVTVTAIPACGTPKNVAVSNILYNAATISWEQGGKETAWVVEYATSEDFTDAVVKEADATSLTLTALTANTTYYVRVKADCDGGYSEAITFTPAYQAPTGVAVSEITATSASIDWTAVSGEEVWTLQYKKAADSEWSSVADLTARPYELTGLSAATLYEVRVLAGEVASATQTFTTECTAVAALGYTEGFEGMTTSNYEATGLLCWNELNAVHSSSYSYPQLYVNNSSDFVQTGSKSLYFVSSSSVYVYAILPEFSGSYEGLQFTFSHKEESASASGIFTLGYLTDAADAATFVEVQVCSRGTSWQKETVNIAAVPAGARLAFRYGGGSSNYYAGIDDIAISEIPSCAVPTGLAASEITADAAVLSWTSEAENFKVQYTTDTENWGEEIDAAEATLALSELESNTTYYARVKAVCGAESESEYSDAISFKTLCAVEAMPFAESFEAGVPECWATTGSWASSTDYAHSGSALRANIRYNGASLTTPSIAISEDDAELVFYLRNAYGSSNYAAGTVTVTAEGEEPVEYAFINAKADNLEKQKVDLSAFYGKSVQITFSAASVGSSAYLSIDEVTVDKKQCATPTNVTANTASHSATIAWTAGDDEAAWQLQYKATAASEWTLVEGLTNMTHTLTGLTNGTEYEARVRAYCDEAHQSEWSEAVQFTPSIPTGVDNTADGEGAVKVIENDQIVIILHGVKYNTQGQKLQ